VLLNEQLFVAFTIIHKPSQTCDKAGLAAQEEKCAKDLAVQGCTSPMVYLSYGLQPFLYNRLFKFEEVP
jgi:hypothetical protein